MSAATWPADPNRPLSLTELAERQGHALRALEGLGHPSTHDERWREAPVRDLEVAHKRPRPIPAHGGDASPPRNFPGSVAPAEATGFVIHDDGQQMLVEAPGQGASHRDAFVGSLAQFAVERPDYVREYFDSWRPEAVSREDRYRLENTARVRDGLLVYVPDDVVLEEPIEWWVYPNASRPERRALVILGSRARATVFERRATRGGEGDGVTVNAVCEVILGQEAQLDWTRFGEVRSGEYDLNFTAVRVGALAQFRSVRVARTAGYLRDEIRLDLVGDEAMSSVLSAAVVQSHGRSDELVDTRHRGDRGRSDHVARTVVNGQARGSVIGAVGVAPAARGNHAEQSLKALVASTSGHAAVRPMLNIENDEVSCSHGATIGQPSDEALYYLRARGLDTDQAMALLQRAFVEEVVASAPVGATYVLEALGFDRPELIP